LLKCSTVLFISAGSAWGPQQLAVPFPKGFLQNQRLLAPLSIILSTHHLSRPSDMLSMRTRRLGRKAILASEDVLKSFLAVDDFLE